MKRQPSTQAQVARIIRAKLKEYGIPAKVTSHSASMMTAVDVYVENQPPWAIEAIESFCSQFEYGHFNGMEDIYEYSNRRDDIPQVKFLAVHNEFSDDMREAAYQYLRANFATYKEAPATLAEAQHFIARDNGGVTYASDEVWQVLNGSMDARTRQPGTEWDLHFWHKPRQRAIAA